MNPDFIAALARSITDKSARETVRSQVLPGTVTAFRAASGRGLPIASVHVNGDPQGRTVDVVVIGGTVSAGQTVMIMFTPPEGAVTWGTQAITPPVTDIWLLSAEGGSSCDATCTEPDWTADIDPSTTMTSVEVQYQDTTGAITIDVMKNGSTETTVTTTMVGAGPFVETFDITDIEYVLGDVVEFCYDRTGTSSETPAVIATMTGVHDAVVLPWELCG